MGKRYRVIVPRGHAARRFTIGAIFSISGSFHVKYVAPNSCRRFIRLSVI